MAKLNGYLCCVTALAVLCAAIAAAYGGETEKQTQPMRVINVTSDSASGWLPSVDQSNLAEKTARDYLAAEDAGNAESAYNYLNELDKRDQPLEAYAINLQKFNAKSGPVIERRLVKVTWTKDSPNAPIPGVYAAIDIASRFANIDRQCGYLVLYQAPSGGVFQIMREENNFIDNDSAARIEQQRGRDGLDQIWAQLSSNCPNYPGPAPKP